MNSNYDLADINPYIDTYRVIARDCPFCGKAPTLCPQKGQFHIICIPCNYSGELAKTPGIANTLWNSQVERDIALGKTRNELNKEVDGWMQVSKLSNCFPKDWKEKKNS